MREHPDLTYDTGALIAAERADEDVWSLHEDALRKGILPTVPAAVLAQAWRGGPQPLLSRFLAGCRIEPLDAAEARSAGAACAIAGTSDIVDATVVVGAAQRDDVIVTSDPDDITRLTDALGVRLSVVAI